MAEYMEYEWRSQAVQVDRAGVLRGRSLTEEQQQSTAEEVRKRAAEDAAPEWRPAVFSETNHSIRRFLYARKWDLDKASALLLSYRRHLAQHGPLLGELRDQHKPPPADVVEALRSSLPGVLEDRDRRGRRVLVIFAANWDSTRHTLAAVYRAIWHTLERLTCSCTDHLQNMVNGLVLVVDWSELPVRTVGALSPRLLRDIVDGLQDCFPVRFKAVHMLNQPWWLEPPLIVLKRFLTEKSRARLHTHGNNLATLHEHLPPDILPAELGGERSEHSTEHWLNMVHLNTSQPT